MWSKFPGFGPAMTQNEGGSGFISEGLEWVDRMTSGLATEADAQELRHWRNQSPEHARALQDALALRRGFVRLGKRHNEVAQAPARYPWVAHRRAFLGGGLAAAAGLTGFAVIRPPLSLWPSLNELTADYRTAKGEQRNLAVADGLSVDMNTLTSLSNRSTSGAHGFELVNGEIAVTARLGEAKPVAIFASGGRIVASRAQFDVRTDTEGVCVTCSQDSVRVEAAGAVSRLDAGQQLTYMAGRVGRVLQANANVVTAWRSGQLVLHEKPFTEAIAEINRYRSGVIIVASSALRKRQINAVLQLSQIDEVVPLICRLTGAQATTVGDYVVLT
jgi:transmembrane sensor